MIDNVVLGGGIAGIAAAHQAKAMGKSAIVFEAQERAGGLLDNFTVEGFRFDTAVHLSFASEEEVREAFDQTPYRTHLPEAVNWDKDRWLRHPVQNNMYGLPVEERVELVAGLSEAPDVPVNNYRDWLVHQYGEPIAARWPMVYTEKYWTVPAERLGVDWIGQRVRRADLREVLRGAFTEDSTNTFYAKEMRYPEEGGYRAFLNSMLREVEIQTGQVVEAVDPTTKSVRFANGRVVEYKNIVSTLPLPLLVRKMSAPTEVQVLADTLFATEVDLISIGFNRPKVSPTLWFYIYDPEIWAARAYAPDWKSPSNAPPGCSSLQFEIYSSREKPMQHSVEELKQNTLWGLERMGVAKPADVLFVHHKRLRLANVVFDLGMESRRDEVRAWVESQGVHVAGRFGEWAYLWSNQAMMSGLRAAREAFS
jgi:protoporphyrinogen oxidase